MGYQSGQVGPIMYHQDNTGVGNDIYMPIAYTPEMFGAPPGSQFITPMVQQTVHVLRGSAAVHGYAATADAINFTVWTQAADNGIFGHHSGAIDVGTTFTWWVYEADAAAKEGYKPSEEDAIRWIKPKWI